MTLRLSSIPTPRSHPTLLTSEFRQYVGYDVANPSREVRCEGVTEYGARVDAAIKLRVCTSRVAVRPALPGTGEA